MLKPRQVLTSEATPGPWSYDETWALIRGPNGEEVAAVHSGQGDGERRAPGVAVLNAQLIAAAPDLLESLRGIRERTDALRARHPEYADMIDTVLHARDFAAIAKAEGR
jgi:hypothetical protein